ncbi:hypothetical protein C4D60_Mb08t10220 [Musa balbisiana]|uniref:Protein-serine/threonine kinase n=1 Tax=Musa balbisiana TaxID=52838 RepID=A0A4S8K2Q7_MUSBA|nr:hypothetical protein C4D60_Mb08t10220 [Musa balbisiana]
MAAESVPKALAEEVRRWGAMKRNGVSLRYMMEFGARPTPTNLLLSAQFLHKELSARIARRAIELESLPLGLSGKPAVLKVRDWYLDSFRDLRSFPKIKDPSDELSFTQLIKMIKLRHNNVVPAMALGVQQLKRDMNRKLVPKELEEIHQFLDRFYMSRIGIRMLIGQHVALHDPDPEPGCVGQINTKLSPMQVARTASEDARSICFREYGSAPEVDIYGDPNFTFPYVPSHLHLMLFELVKNSLRAVQERFMDSDKDAPPVRIIVADGIEDVTIKEPMLTFICLDSGTHKNPSPEMMGWMGKEREHECRHGRSGHDIKIDSTRKSENYGQVHIAWIFQLIRDSTNL